MKITLNNRPEVFEQDELTVSQILEVKRFTFKMLVIKVNGKLVKKDAYESSKIKHGDDVTVIHLISGG
jgi:thiamine biosynthesis protein ThiS